MSRRHRPGVRLSAEATDDLLAVGRAAGLDLVGACRARSWTSARTRLEATRHAGLAADMEFTFRNPARSTEPTRVLRGAASLVVAARSYAQQAPDADPDGCAGHDDRPRARVARYATADHYGRLRAGLAVVADALRDHGARAVVLADDNSLVDREAAWRAGLGSYGKNSLLLVPGRGSWFVLGSVVTDAVLHTAPQPVGDACGACRRCLDGCPTGAIVAPGVVDARRCLAWLLQAPGSFPVEYRAALGDRIYGCDDCQEVCPPNRVAERAVERASERTGSSAWPVEDDPGGLIDAVALLELGDDELLERCARWYLPGRDPAVVRRNLLVVLGNSGSSHPDVERLLDRYATGDDEVLAEHARWAQQRRAALAGTGPTDED